MPKVKKINVDLTRHATIRFMERFCGESNLGEINGILQENFSYGMLRRLSGKNLEGNYMLKFPKFSSNFILSRRGEQDYVAITFKRGLQPNEGKEVDIWYKLL